MYHFILTSYSLYTQVIPILISIDVQYLQNVVFGFEKGSKGQNHSLSDSQHPIKKSLKQPFPFLHPISPYYIKQIYQYKLYYYYLYLLLFTNILLFTYKYLTQ